MTQRSATLVRQPSTDQGTFGVLTTDRGDRFHTGELPWRDNKAYISCVPVGTYLCTTIDSPNHGLVYVLHDVPGRSGCEIHVGNWCGDKSKGYKSDVLGCILLGTDVGNLAGQRAVLHSGKALELFLAAMNGEDFELTIE